MILILASLHKAPTPGRLFTLIASPLPLGYARFVGALEISWEQNDAETGSFALGLIVPARFFPLNQLIFEHFPTLSALVQFSLYRLL